MTLTLHLSLELIQRLTDGANQCGASLEAYVSQILNRSLPPSSKQEVIDLLQSWIDEGDVAEQTETGEYLIRVLDEDRATGRTLFPKELQGVSW